MSENNVNETVEDQELQGHNDQAGADTVRQADATDDEGRISNPTPAENLSQTEVQEADPRDGGEDTDDEDAEADSFPRAYVEKLRKESAGYRDRAKRADEFAHRLHSALVAADGRLADPDDLDFDDAHLDDPEALSGAITDLVKRKPGLRAQQVRGDVGAGERGSRKQAPTDLLTIMKGL